MGEKYDLEVVNITRSREEYQGEAHRVSGLPAAPAVMVDDEVAGQGPEISEEKLEEVIRRHLRLPPSKTQT